MHLEFWWVKAFSGVPQGLEGQTIQWFAWADLSSLVFPEANQPIVKRLVAQNN